MKGYTREERVLLVAAGLPRDHFVDARESEPLIARGLIEIREVRYQWPFGPVGHGRLTELGRIARRIVISGLVALAASCAQPAPVAPTAKHAACSTAAAPELTSCPYREELPKTRLYTSSGLECEHCNVEEFSQ